MKDKKGPFKFPQHTLNQINECSPGGYLLFVFDSEGEPEILSKFDSSMSAMAMQYFIENWAKAMEAVNIQSMADAMLPPEEREDRGGLEE